MASSALFASNVIVLSDLNLSPQAEAEHEMRELFDEVAGHSPFDPEEAVRRATRTPRRKRFYKEAGIAPAEGGFAVTLDGKPIRTPSRRQVVAPVPARLDSRLVQEPDDLVDPLGGLVVRGRNGHELPSSGYAFRSIATPNQVLSPA